MNANHVFVAIYKYIKRNPTLNWYIKLNIRKMLSHYVFIHKTTKMFYQLAFKQIFGGVQCSSIHKTNKPPNHLTAFLAYIWLLANYENKINTSIKTTTLYWFFKKVYIFVTRNVCSCYSTEAGPCKGIPGPGIFGNRCIYIRVFFKGRRSYFTNLPK